MIVVIDYKSGGNTASVKNAVERLGFSCVVSSDPNKIKSADKVIFPGQGRAGSAMRELREKGIDQLIPKLTQPFLGICLGMQLLSEYSAEDETKCLSIIRGECRKFSGDLPVPHLGWNQVQIVQPAPMLEGIRSGEYFYFAHSYYFDASPKKVLGKTAYGVDFPSIVQRNNFFATQFHLEKSGEAGLRLLRNFCEP